EGHVAAVKKEEDRLKDLLGNSDESCFLRALPGVMGDVEQVLEDSARLVGMPLPKASHLSQEDFPLGRLHNLTIAPKRSGARSRASPESLGEGHYQG
ncbi:unnamed protein product, partial [Choristocarpus tenellus]